MLETNLINNKIHNLLYRIKLQKNIFDVSEKNRLEEIEDKLKTNEVWKYTEQVQLLRKELSLLKDINKQIDNITKIIKESALLLELAINENDKNILIDIKFELDNSEKLLEKLELCRMFSGKHDYYNCYIDIQAGSGGTEAQDWANMLLRMYLRWGELHKFKTEIIDESAGEIAGIKSATINIIGNYAHGWLRTETGIHRLVRKSPFDSGGRRHTSFSSVFVYPEINKNINIEINIKDLRIDVYRASGAGGQHVNRTESAVRITHLPTNIVTQCQNDRSQHKNKDKAMKQLKAKLYELEIKKKQIEKKQQEYIKSDINWGNQIRSYILDDSRIKDLRTGIETRNTQSVLNGDIDKFIQASLKAGL
ncbi:peptide chain release factor 2 [Candidatus Palibaumannia cicadellinicola]|uniref:Peptide chain release factor 2 n=1 Tax=Candidatus Palibaumannia cicadellinicola TaxID=186490 RepID=A0A0K2BKN0_9GAMM|nr:peptide chain release factor 2 [Candidatus Baumannia cicadellinicola]AKZ65749.1 Peptide chain release factor 2 [Candidatus Baumannia cicadellinicola]